MNRYTKLHTPAEIEDLSWDVEHLMLAMLHADPDKFRELCSLLDEDPADFAAFLKRDTKQHDH